MKSQARYSLLKLYVNLKSEIGITAFGKCIQIMDSIAGLCQLPSVTCSNDQLQFNHSTDAISQSQSGFQPELYLHTTVQGPNQCPALCSLPFLCFPYVSSLNISAYAALCTAHPFHIYSEISGLKTCWN